MAGPTPPSDSSAVTRADASAGWRRWANVLLALGAACVWYFDGHYGPILVTVGVAALASRLAKLDTWRFLTLTLAFFVGEAALRWARVPRAYQNILPHTALVMAAFAAMQWRDLRGALALPRWRRALWLVPVVAVASCIAVYVWFGHYPRCRLPGPYRDLPRWVLWMGMPAFVVANALCEELVMRVAVLSALRRAFGATAAVFVQAIAFGLWHWVGGMPFGPAGAAMAFAFGAALGVVRIATRSVWPCVVTHGIVSVFMGTVFLSRATTWFGTVRWWPLLGGVLALSAALAAFAFVLNAALGLRSRP